MYKPVKGVHLGTVLVQVMFFLLELIPLLVVIIKTLQVFHHWHLACVSQKTRKLLWPNDFSGLFSGEFLGSQKVPKNTPDSHPSFSGCFLGFAAQAWLWFAEEPKFTRLHWAGFLMYATNQTFFRWIKGKLLALPFICTVSTPFTVLWLIVKGKESLM